MSNPDDLKSIFEDPSDIEMEDLTKSNHTQVAKVQPITQVYLIDYSTQAVPHHGTSIDPRPTPMVPTVVSQPTSNDIAIAPMIPTDPLFPP